MDIINLKKIVKFKNNTKELFVVNQLNPVSASLSNGKSFDFSSNSFYPAGYVAKDFSQQQLKISFTINDVPFVLNTASSSLPTISISKMMGHSFNGIYLV